MIAAPPPSLPPSSSSSSSSSSSLVAVDASVVLVDRTWTTPAAAVGTASSVAGFVAVAAWAAPQVVGIAAAVVALASVSALANSAGEMCVAHVGKSHVTIERTRFGITRDVWLVERHEVRAVRFERRARRLYVGWKPVPCVDERAAARLAALCDAPFESLP